MSKDQIYYEFLVRTDHPVFARDFSATTTIDSSYNSVLNRIFAREMVKVRTLIEEMRLNMYPETVTALTIDDWEIEYFGFTKPSLPLAQRVSELMIKFNKRFKMNVGDVVDLARAIVGTTPTVVRSLQYDGWQLGKSSMGTGSVFGGASDSPYIYLVTFPDTIDTNLLEKLDERLTIIEKAGSTHKIVSPRRYWIIGKAALGIDTTLGA